MNPYLYLSPDVLFSTLAADLDRLAADPAGIHNIAAQLRLAAVERRSNPGATLADDVKQFGSDVVDATKDLFHQGVAKVDGLVPGDSGGNVPATSEGTNQTQPPA